MNDGREPVHPSTNMVRVLLNDESRNSEPPGQRSDNYPGRGCAWVRTTALLASLVIAVLFVVACGDGESSTASHGETPGPGAQVNESSAPNSTAVGSGSADAALPETIRLTLDAQPSPDWTVVNVPGWESQRGFHLRLPPGWQVVQTQGIDSYVGEVLGNGMRLKFDYGLHSWSLNPEDDPKHEYVLLHEDTGEVERKLLIPKGGSGGFTGVYFAQLDGPNRLNLIGQDLTPEHQHIAIAIFRSVRSGTADDGESIAELGAPVPTPSGPAVILSVGYEGMQYLRVAGPIREELLDLDQLTSTGLVLDEYELVNGSEGRRVYLLPGVAIEEGFLVRSINTWKGPHPADGGGDTSYPVCQPGSGAYVYTAEGASPPPWWPSSPQPAYSGGPTPTPVPTPDSPIVAVALTSEGFLEAGWPIVNMERLQFHFGGVEYDYAGFGYINDDHGADTSISPDAIEEVDILSMTYFVDMRPLSSPALQEIASDNMVIDQVRVYRLVDRPVSDVIVIDQCPADLQGDHFVLYEPIGARAGARESSTPTPVVGPVPGESQRVLDRQAGDERRMRQVLSNFPERNIVWVDQDTVVYRILADPHDLAGPKVAVAYHIPTRTIASYMLDKATDLVILAGEELDHHPHAPAVVARMKRDPRVREAVEKLLGSCLEPSCDKGERPQSPGETPSPSASPSVAASAKDLPTPTPEPRPFSDDGAKPPEYVRLDIDNNIVVAFADDQPLGRIAYITHVPTGAQAILDKGREVIEKHVGTGEGDAIIEATLSNAAAMSRIQIGLLYEEDLPGNGFMDWVNSIRFDGISYVSNAMRGGGGHFHESQLGPVLYRVAFHVDANFVPGSYRIRDGDATHLPPGTPIYSVKGYPPSEVLAAVVDREVWRFRGTK